MTQDERFDRIDDTLERLGRRFDQVDRRFEQLDKYIQDFRGEVVLRLGAIETQMGLLAASQASFEARLPVITKSAHDNAAAISFLFGRQSDAGASNFELMERVRKLEEKVAKLDSAA